jgi:hypothetical protein
MPRQLRIEYPGAIYHPPAFDFGATSVMNRGFCASQSSLMTPTASVSSALGVTLTNDQNQLNLV